MSIPMKAISKLLHRAGAPIARGAQHDEFLARGLRSGRDAQQTGVYHAAEEVRDELTLRLDARRRNVLDYQGN